MIGIVGGMRFNKMDKIKKEQDNKIPFDVVAKEIENALKQHIKDVC